MKVSEFFTDERIELDFIERKFSGDYWEKAENFVREKWDVDMDDLTQTQADWLYRIREDCAEKRIEGA